MSSSQGSPYRTLEATPQKPSSTKKSPLSWPPKFTTDIYRDAMDWQTALTMSPRSQKIEETRLGEQAQERFFKAASVRREQEKIKTMIDKARKSTVQKAAKSTPPQKMGGRERAGRKGGENKVKYEKYKKKNVLGRSSVIFRKKNSKSKKEYIKNKGRYITLKEYIKLKKS